MAANPHGYAKLDNHGRAAKVQNATRTATLTGRKNVLRDIAERYHHLVEPNNSRTELPGTGELVPAMPPTYTPTVREFERLMALMRNQARQKAHDGHSLGQLWWHLRAYYVDAEPRIVWRPRTAHHHGRKRRLRGTVRPEIAPRRHPDARRDKAELALDWIALNWGLRTEPELYVDKP